MRNNDIPWTIVVCATWSDAREVQRLIGLNGRLRAVYMRGGHATNLVIPGHHTEKFFQEIIGAAVPFTIRHMRAPSRDEIFAALEEEAQTSGKDPIGAVVPLVPASAP